MMGSSGFETFLCSFHGFLCSSRPRNVGEIKVISSSHLDSKKKKEILLYIVTKQAALSLWISFPTFSIFTGKKLIPCLGKGIMSAALQLFPNHIIPYRRT